MFDHLLRGLKDRLLAPLARLCVAVPPDVISLIAFGFGLAAAWAAYRGAWTAGLLLWLANRITDGLDGAVARLADRQTDFGGYLDIMLDFVVYALIPVGCALGSESRPVWSSAIILEATFFVNAASWMYLSAVLEKRQAGAAARGELTTVTMPPGLIAGFETVVFFSLFYLVPARQALLFSVMAALVAVTIGQRLIWARSALSRNT
jgi:phosphatidylglycerophosphate synthase